jgi:Mannosyl-glycoprotein endo-beta-N-acetylglucosaminidase
MATPDEIRAFAAQYGPLAAAQAQRLGTDPVNVLAQWGLETGYGKSIIPGTNNLGNIKGAGVAAVDNQLGTTDSYRAYANPAAGAAGYGDLLTRRYPQVQGTSTPQQFAQAVQAGGYAEDPRYVDKLTGTANTLQRYASNVLGAMTGSSSAYAGELTPAQRAYSSARYGPTPPPTARGQQTQPAQADPWAALEQKHSIGGDQAAAAPADPWAALEQQYAIKPQQDGGAPASTSATGTAPPAAPTPAAAGDTNAFEDAASAFGHHLMNAGWGATQTGANLLLKGAEAIAPDSTLTASARRNVAQLNAEATAREAEYQRTQPNGVGTAVGAFAGDALPYLAVPFGAAGRVAGAGVEAASAALPVIGSTVARAAPLVGNMLAGGGLSALGTGILSPVTGDAASSPDAWAAAKNRQMNTAAVIGAATPAAMAAAGAGARAVGRGARSLWDRIAPAVSDSAAQQQATTRIGDAITNDLAARQAAQAAAPPAPPMMQPPPPNVPPAGMIGPPAPLVGPQLPVPAAQDARGGLLNALTGEQERQRIAQNLLGARSIIPGSAPTAAEVAESPTISAIQKAASNRPEFKIPLMERAEANNAARFATLQAAADQGGGSQALINARNELTDPLYASADETVVPVSDALKSLMNRPSMQTAIGNARALAQERGLPFNMTDDAATINGVDAHQIKKAFDGILYDSGRTLDPNMRAAISNTQQEFLGALENDIPAYGQARQLYAQHSPQINGAVMAEDLQNELRQGAMNSTDPDITFNAFKSKLAKYRKAQDFPIDPDTNARLDAIQQDLQRATRLNSVRAGGSDTFYNSAADTWFSNMTGKQSVLGQAVASGIGAAGLGSVLGPAGAAAGAVLGPVGNAVRQRSEEAINREIARLLLNPQELGSLLNSGAAAGANVAPVAVDTLARRLGSNAALGGLLGSLAH